MEGFSAASTNLNTNVFFPTENISDCQSLYPLLKNTTNINDILNKFKLQDNSTGFLKNLSSLRNSLLQMDAFSNLDSTDQETILPYLNTVENTQIPVLRLVNSCLEDKVNLDWNTWNKQKETLEESKDRLDSIQSPEQSVTYYEGWFPLFRPMTENVLFILFGLSIFLLLLSTVFFLQFQGIELKFILPQSTGFGSDSSSYKSYLLGGGAVGILFAILAYYLGWFSKDK